VKHLTFWLNSPLSLIALPQAARAERKASAAAASRGDCLNPGDHQLFIALARALHLFVSRRAHAAAASGSGKAAAAAAAAVVPRVADEAAHGSLSFASLGLLWDAVLAARGSPGGLPRLLNEFVAAMRYGLETGVKVTSYQA
jgi:hypothetical protein